MIKILNICILIFCTHFIPLKLEAKDSVRVKNNVFEVNYSQILEQPLWVVYHSTNRISKVNRGSMDFYTIPNIHTSDDEDYKYNDWDKGHLSPAESFTDNIGNLKKTFSYLNCVLQQKDLNRGEWKYLEAQERIWDDKENLTIRIDIIFDKDSEKLPTGATVPTFFVKHIHFDKSNTWKCYRFSNTKPTKKWTEYEIKCNH